MVREAGSAACWCGRRARRPASAGGGIGGRLVREAGSSAGWCGRPGCEEEGMGERTEFPIHYSDHPNKKLDL
jgi:hypothetical protein